MCCFCSSACLKLAWAQDSQSATGWVHKEMDRTCLQKSYLKSPVGQSQLRGTETHVAMSHFVGCANTQHTLIFWKPRSFSGTCANTLSVCLYLFRPRLSAETFLTVFIHGPQPSRRVYRRWSAMRALHLSRARSNRTQSPRWSEATRRADTWAVGVAARIRR